MSFRIFHFITDFFYATAHQKKLEDFIGVRRIRAFISFFWCNNDFAGFSVIRY